MNEVLWLAAFFATFAIMIGIYLRLGRIGLFAWIPLATLLANIQVTKTVEIFGITATLGNVAYASVFLATDILSENHGKKDAAIAVLLGFFSLISSMIMMSLSLAFAPAGTDFAHDSMKTLFSVMPRVALASLAAYIASQLYDIWSYHFLKKKLPSTRFLWLRNNASTLVSQLLDTVVFTVTAFYGLYPKNVFFSIVISTYLLKALASVLDTPFIYIASAMYRRGRIKEL